MLCGVERTSDHLCRWNWKHGDLREFARISGEKLDYTIGSALDLLAVRFRMPS